MKGEGGAEPSREVLSRFPEGESLIRSLFSTDEGFRELCGDYAECVLVIERLRRGQGESGERIGQYCELRANLEFELQLRIAMPAGESKARASDHDTGAPDIQEPSSG